MCISRSRYVYSSGSREREYELNDHLGNARYRFSDLKRTTGGAGHPPFKADMLGYDNYYPFGMMPEDRRATALTGGIGRYRYNGKEMDNEFNDRNGAGDGTANSYDYGFRMYEPRLGKWLSSDPAAHLYPENSSYEYALNNPIRWIDADGAVVRDQFGNIVMTVANPNDAYSLGPFVTENPNVALMWSVPAQMGYIMNDATSYIQVYAPKNTTPYLLFYGVTHDAYGGVHYSSNPIDGYLDYESDSRYNCTGNALTDQHFIINSDQITRQYLEEEHFRQVELVDAQAGDVGIYSDRTNGVTDHLERFLTSIAVDTKGGFESRPFPQIPYTHPGFSKEDPPHTMADVYTVWRKEGQDVRVLPRGFYGPILPNEIVLDFLLPTNSYNGVTVVPQNQFQKIHDQILQHNADPGGD